MRHEYNDMKHSISISRWLILCLCVIVMIVAVGGITRLTESGLSMVEWKPLMGAIPPMNETDWLETFDKYKATPQFQILNKEMELPEFKQIFFWEWFHRLLGRAIGLIYGLPFFYFLFRKQLRPKLALLLGIALILGGAQGVLGWYMVQSGLVDVPHVSHFRLAAHLMLALSLFVYLLWIVLGLRLPQEDRHSSVCIKLRQGALFFALILIVQIMYGAFVAGLNAGWAYNTFPKMLGQWIPPGFLDLSPAIKNFFHNIGTVQWMHRTLGWVLLVGLSLYGYRGGQLALSPQQRLALRFTVAVIWIQFILGVATLLLHVPIAIATLHQVTACFVLAGFTFLLHSTRKI